MITNGQVTDYLQREGRGAAGIVIISPLKLLVECTIVTFDFDAACASSHFHFSFFVVPHLYLHRVTCPFSFLQLVVPSFLLVSFSAELGATAMKTDKRTLQI